MWGFTHLIAHQREANRFESHSFTQPPRRCDTSQRQKQPPAGTFRSNPGVSARSVNEQKRKTNPRRYALQWVCRKMVLPMNPRIKVILSRAEKKTDSLGSSKILLPGSWNQATRSASDSQNGGSSELKPQCGFGASAWSLHRANLSISKYLCGLVRT